MPERPLSHNANPRDGAQDITAPLLVVAETSGEPVPGTRLTQFGGSFVPAPIRFLAGCPADRASPGRLILVRSLNPRPDFLFSWNLFRLHCCPEYGVK
jgi:hypothetical protein